MSAFINDNLLRADEVVSPTLENLIVLLWLEKLHPRLPALVKQKYATSLRSKTLYSLKPEISMTIPSLLEEAQSVDDARVMRLGGSGPRPSYSRFNQPRNGKQDKKNSPKCAFCDLACRQSSHFLSKCHYLPAGDKKFLAKSRRVMSAFEVEEDQSADEEESYYEDQNEQQYVEE